MEDYSLEDLKAMLRAIVGQDDLTPWLVENDVE